VTEDVNTTETEGDSKYPVYPGATRRSGATYETSDSLEQVKTYYTELLGVEPAARDEGGNAFTYTTAEFLLVIVRLPYESGGGTEINFSPPEQGR
jgi:hypothetical protein